MTREGIGDTRIQETQRETSESAELFDKTRMGLRDLPLARVLREWQTSLMGYYQEVRRYRETPNLERVWYEDISDDWAMSLDELQDVAYDTDSRMGTSFDPDLQTTVPNEINEPKTFPPRRLRGIKDKLDECYHALGFDEPPENKLPESGPRGQGDSAAAKATPTEFVELDETAAEERPAAAELADD